MLCYNLFAHNIECNQFIAGGIPMFNKNIRAIYLYAVCFITLMMILGGLIATVHAVTQFALPTANSWQTPVQLQRNIINSIAVWLIAAPIFALHWRQTVKLNRKDEVDSDA